MLLNRVDNFFYNTNDVEALADFYATAMRIRPRREQIQQPGLTWKEINLGGMELSFRRANAVPVIHPTEARDFLELPPGRGATISFEVTDTDYVRAQLSAKGVKFRGDALPCTGGQELISIFEDIEGRPVQLYEGRFTNSDDFHTAERAGSSIAGGGTMTIGAPALVGLNVRDARDLAMSLAFYSDDLAATDAFYGRVLGLNQVVADEHRIVYELDGTIIEFRSSSSPVYETTKLGYSGRGHGGIVAIEVRNLSRAGKMVEDAGAQQRFRGFDGTVGPIAGPRAGYSDRDRNPFELWER